MRFSRDKRGYETTALVDTGGRRRGRGPRLLYWFRTPPGVRVGRAPIDDEAMRLLQVHNPDVEFDWPRLLKEPVPEPQPRRDRDPRDRRREPRDARPAPRTRPMETTAAAVPPMSREVALELEAEAEAADRRSAEHATRLATEHTASAEAAEEYAEDMGQTAAADQTERADQGEPAPIEEPMDHADLADVPPAALERLGGEGVRRLRARYLDLVARIEEKGLEEDARVELNAAAERLNPDSWRTPDEVAAALEQYETVFESLRSVVGRQPRRRV